MSFTRSAPFSCLKNGGGWGAPCKTQCYRCAHEDAPEPINPLVTTDFKIGEELMFGGDPTKLVNFLYYDTQARCCCRLANGSIGLFNQHLLSRQ